MAKLKPRKYNSPGRKCNEDQCQYKDQTGGHLSDYVVLFCKISLGLIAYQSQRHITFIATEEILCGGLHKISKSHPGPSASFVRGAQSIGSMNSAFLLGRELN